MKATKLSEVLFFSVRQRIVFLLFSHPEHAFNTFEIVKKLRSGNGAVERQMLHLRRSGMVSVKWVGNQKRYCANRDFPLFKELRSVVLKITASSRRARKRPS
jgi:hypothetical protein